MKKINALALVMLIVLSYALTIFVACNPYATKPQKPTEHKHSLTYVAAVEETCTQDGMMEHWDCDSCGKTFSDSEGEHEVQKSSLVVSAHHTLTHKTEQKATCTADGNIDYYHCSACGENFLDENGKNRVDLDDTVLASKGHVVGDQWEHDKNGHWKVCSACHNVVEYAPHNFEDYVCKDCGAEDEQNKPMSEEEIVEKVVAAVEFNLKDILSIQSTITDIIAIDNVGTDLIILVKNTKPQGDTQAEFLNLISIPMTTELTIEGLKAESYKPTSKRAGESLMLIPLYSDDERGVQILKKIDPQGDHDHYDFVSVTENAGAIIPGIGPTKAYRIYTIDKNGLVCHLVGAQNNYGDDVIQDSILNGTENSTYYVYDNEKEFEFSENVIYNFDGLLKQQEEKTFNIMYAGKKVGYAKGNVMCYQLEQ